MIQTDSIPYQKGRQRDIKTFGDFRKRVSLANDVNSGLPFIAVFFDQLLESTFKSVRAALGQI